MRALAVALLTLAACSPSRKAPAPPAPRATLDATIANARGGVAGATVRLVALPDGRCPCTAELDAAPYGNEMPSCACPEALASWQKRAAACESPSRAITTVVADAAGHAELTRLPGVTAIEVAAPGGVRWLPWPTTGREITVDLGQALAPRIKIANAADAQIRGAILFDDGHCVPIDRKGDAWAPRVPIPEFGVVAGTLVVEAPGYATIIYSLFDQQQIDLELHRDRVAHGTCSEGGTARLDNPFEHRVTKLDANKQFSFGGAVDMTSTVSCWENATTMTEEWQFTPEDGLSEDDVNVYGGTFGGSCVDVKVVDDANRPIADADISAMRDQGLGMSTGTGATTDKNGIACIDDLDAGIELAVSAPAERGGECAGKATLKVEQRHLANPPLVVRLRIAKLPTARVHGRVVNAEGKPVAGAGVGIQDIEPFATPDCSTNGGGWAATALDGTFEIPAQPRGTVSLRVDHDWYIGRDLTVKNDGSAHDIVLERGSRLTGHILDPDGNNVAQCKVWLRLARGRLLSATCSPTGFEFDTVTPGDAELQVRVEHHPLGEFRTLRKKVHLDGGAGKALTLDVAFAKGQEIAGKVVDQNGNAIPNVRLRAIPKGTRESPSTIHDDEVQFLTDASGHFSFRHLRPGTWTIRGYKNGKETTMDVAAGTANVTFVVEDVQRPPGRPD